MNTPSYKDFYFLSEAPLTAKKPLKKKPVKTLAQKASPKKIDPDAQKKKNLVGINQYWYDKSAVTTSGGKRKVKPGSTPKYVTGKTGKLEPFNPKVHGKAPGVRRSGAPLKKTAPKGGVAPISTTKDTSQTSYELTDKDVARLKQKKVRPVFIRDLQTALKAAKSGKSNIVKAFIDKYDVRGEKRATGFQVYAYKTPASNKKAYIAGSRKPFGDAASSLSNSVYQALAKAAKVPSISDRGGFGGAPADLFTANVFRPIPGGKNPEIVRHNGIEAKSFKLGNFTVDHIELSEDRRKSLIEKHGPQKGDIIIRAIEVRNEQLKALNHLFDAQGNFKGVTYMPGPDSTGRIRDDIVASIHKVEGVDPNRKERIGNIITQMSTLSGSEEQIIDGFDKLEMQFMKEINSTKDGLTAGRAYMCESLAALRENLLGGLVIIPTASDFPTGDIISFRENKTLPAIVSVTVNLASVKFGDGAESSQIQKVALTSYKSSQFGSGDEIKALLQNMMRFKEEDSIYRRLFYHKDFKSVSAELDKYFAKFAPLVAKYYGVDVKQINAIRSEMSMGRSPKVVNGKIVKQKGIPLYYAGKCKNIKAWQMYSQVGFLVDVINNSLMEFQGFRNNSFTNKGVNESSGGFPMKGKRIYGMSEFRPDKGVRGEDTGNCTPSTKYSAHIKNKEKH